MQTYTTNEARNIVMQCAKQYKKNLLGKTFIIIYRDRYDNKIKDLEVYFGEENYQHLTGIELIDNDGNVRKHVSKLFFDKCIKNGLKLDSKQEYYVPSSSILEDIKKLTLVHSQVLAIFSKEMNEQTYINIRHVAKGLNLNNIQIPEHILRKISLEKLHIKSAKR